MNNVLLLKGEFKQKKGEKVVPHVNIPKAKEYDTKKMVRILSEFENQRDYWKTNDIIPGALVSVHYIEVVAKSNRINKLLCKSNNPTNNIVGARFDIPKGSFFPKNHIITYNVTLDELDETIERLTSTIDIIDKHYDGKINNDVVNKISEFNKNNYPHKNQIAKNNLLGVLGDCCYIDYISRDIVVDANEIDDDRIITFYDVKVSTIELLNRIGIQTSAKNTWNKNTFFLKKDEVLKVLSEYPYFVSMAVVDYEEYIKEFDYSYDDSGKLKLPNPTNEPVVGVIDTAFDKTAYFENWVEYIDTIEEIPYEEKDMLHGTSVSSIIVDGPFLNPALDDGCGRFRVRHFRVANAGTFSSTIVINKIKEIVSKNLDIKVWNLSLGSKLPINNNYISPEAAELDRLQNEYDIVFVIAGTNIPEGKRGPMKIGAPADSLNSITVNSVKRDNTPASYSRTGPVLSFFYKPDISYYGGDKKVGNDSIHICPGSFDSNNAGTSFSAPWISRKMAYLIGVLGLSREVAKALIIDSAAGWARMDKEPSSFIGYGVVPIRIEDIINTPNDEIRFIVQGTINAYETYFYNLPIPIENGKQPFISRTTLCYFPVCDRNQGVDYTSTEMDVHFGRTYLDKKNKVQIKTINDNTQSDDIKQVLSEYNARNNYRKWDNIKHIGETIKTRKMPKAVYGKGFWGLSIRTKERTQEKNGQGLKFGVVVTLKEMFGKNKIAEFTQLCQFNGWFVNTLSVENMNKINIVAEETIEFKE